jgi:hypothetical protein
LRVSLPDLAREIHDGKGADIFVQHDDIDYLGCQARHDVPGLLGATDDG